MFGLVRVGTASPKLKVADCIFNKEEILKSIASADNAGVQILVFPELCITGYNCGDLFFQSTLLASAEAALSDILWETKGLEMLIALGLPVAFDNQTFDIMVMIHRGKILGAVPKTFLPDYDSFHEERWFSSAKNMVSDTFNLCGQGAPIGTDLIFTDITRENLLIAAEICEDLWAPIPPSSYHTLMGATLILNSSASLEQATKDDYRRILVSHHSARCITGYAYSAAGANESTAYAVFSGHSIISENGSVLCESKKFSRESTLIFSDIDLELILEERKRRGYFNPRVSNVNFSAYRKITFSLNRSLKLPLAREINPKPFLPSNEKTLDDRCFDIFSIQATGLAGRVSYTGSKKLVIGISGGLDSTLALLVSVKAFDLLGIPRKNILGISMPGFGTTDRTYNNALSLINALGVTSKVIPIADAVNLHFKDIGQDPENHDVTYENSQARERTQILMDIANKENGLVVGTGDLSELALGFATYNGDHMSMYNVNTGVPKTLIRTLIKWIARTDFVSKDAKDVLFDVSDTPVSPELLPPDESGKIQQKTEEIIGPYELSDFFLYYMVRFGFGPKKILFLAETAFAGNYDRETILKWLKIFYRRFFSQQFKRACLPDGPRVGSVSLSTRDGWHMPSDVYSTIWLKELEEE